MSPKKIDTIAGKVLREQRIRVKLSQGELAAAVGCSYQQIQKYESGANRVSLSRLFDLAKALGLEPHEFVWLVARRHVDAMLQRRKK